MMFGTTTRMRPNLSSSMIGFPHFLQQHSSSGPSGLSALKGWRVSSPPETLRSPCLKKATCVLACPVTFLHTSQWHVWLSIGSALDDVSTHSQPPTYLGLLVGQTKSGRSAASMGLPSLGFEPPSLGSKKAW